MFGILSTTLFDRLTKWFDGFQNNTHALHSVFANLLTLLRSRMLLLTGSKKSRQPIEFHWIYSKLWLLHRLSSSFIITRKVSDRKTEALTHFMLFIQVPIKNNVIKWIVLLTQPCTVYSQDAKNFAFTFFLNAVLLMNFFLWLNFTRRRTRKTNNLCGSFAKANFAL